ncbi:MAG: hypothetical protein WA678_07785 [Rhabdochlamydiaceae bacterium]|jgi:hypothetical protein
MTIYLPSDPVLFRQAFDAACDRILCSEQDIAFYALYVELTSRLQEHPHFKDYLLGLENESGNKRREFGIAALEALEDSWIKLWKYHRHSLKHRQQLVNIKRMVTAPHEISYSPLYHRILFRLWEFRYFSPFCRFIEEAPRLFRSAQSALHLASIQYNHLYPSEKKYFSERKAAPLKLSKKDRRRSLCKRIFDPGANNMPFKRSVEQIHSTYFSSKTEQIEKRFSIPGQNNYEKRRNMQIMAETDPVFCWERIRFLQQCYAFNEALPALDPSKGQWPSVRENVWKSAQEKCEIETLLGAKMALMQKLSPQPCSAIDSFLLSEHQIHRKGYEKHLQSLKNHIHAQLYKIENTQKSAIEDPRFTLPGTQREWFVIDLSSRFWTANPLGKQDDAFEYYQLKCPFQKLLSRARWRQIIRKRKLDPRHPAAKKRGPGKKTCQN